MRYLIILSSLLTLSLGGYFIVRKQPILKHWVHSLSDMGKIQTLEVRHSAESIMNAHRRELLADNEHTFLEPTLKFYPYLLMEVKYIRGQDRTAEGVILWSLVDGEMVINTNTWETTHGFIDCLNSAADRNDFRIINALAARGGIMDRDNLTKVLNVENDKLDLWVDSCRKKSLIVQSGNNFRLHLENPRLQVTPETRLDQWLVTKSNKHAHRVARKYRPAQIECIAKASFGNDFAVRKKMEVFLPVYSIVVQNPDGSQMVSYWNALNGKKIERPYILE